MNRTLLLFFSLLAATNAALSQCSIDLGQDTVTIYSGYDPLACTTLAPLVNGAGPVGLLWSNGDTTATLLVCDTASSWYSVTLTDDTLCTATDSVFVNVMDVHCGNNGNKVLVCHVPPGNPANAHTICISENAVPAHLAHGCHLGDCLNSGGNVQPGGNLQMTVSPNPLSKSATVGVRSSMDQHVQVSVIDALGRRLVVLMDADMAAGEERNIDLDRLDLPEGTSLAWLEALGSSDRIARRVILLR